MAVRPTLRRRCVRVLAAAVSVGAAVAVAAACTPVAPITQAAGSGPGSSPQLTGPTDNLTRLANNIVFKEKSVTTQYMTHGGLNLSHRVTIDLAYTANGETTTLPAFDYKESAPTTVVHNIPGNTGHPIHLDERVTLTEYVTPTTTKVFAFTHSVDLRPLFDVTFSPLTFQLTDWPTSYGANGLLIGSVQWSTAQGAAGWKDFYIGSYHPQAVTINNFAQTYYNVGEGEQNPVRYPGISFFLQNPAAPIPITNFVNDAPGPGGEVFEWTGGARTVTYNRVIGEVISGETGTPVAHGRVSYTLTRVLDTYPSL